MGEAVGYQCEVCRSDFVSDRSHEDAVDEMRAIWGNVPQADCAVVCDDCFRVMLLDSR